MENIPKVVSSENGVTTDKQLVEERKLEKAKASLQVKSEQPRQTVPFAELPNPEHWVDYREYHKRHKSAVGKHPQAVYRLRDNNKIISALVDFGRGRPQWLFYDMPPSEVEVDISCVKALSDNDTIPQDEPESQDPSKFKFVRQSSHEMLRCAVVAFLNVFDTFREDLDSLIGATMFDDELMPAYEAVLRALEARPLSVMVGVGQKDFHDRVQEIYEQLKPTQYPPFSTNTIVTLGDDQWQNKQA